MMTAGIGAAKGAPQPARNQPVRWAVTPEGLFSHKTRSSRNGVAEFSIKLQIHDIASCSSAGAKIDALMSYSNSAEEWA